MTSLDGKVAFVTGGARGMGAAEVRRLHGAGATVVAADVLDDEGELLVKELGDRAHYRHLDVTSEDEWAALVGWIDSELGRVDVLVNNAGILRFNSITDTPLDEFRTVLDVNLIGTFLGMKTVIPLMKRSGGRVDRQHLLDRGARRHPAVRRVHRQQVRCTWSHEGRGDRVRRRPDPCQLGAPGRDRYADDA